MSQSDFLFFLFWYIIEILVSCQHKINKYIYIYIYKNKNWNVIFIVITLLLSYISSHIIHLFSTISLLYFTLLLLNFVSCCYTFSNLFLTLLPFHFSTTLNINVTLLLSLHLPFIFDSFYPHPITINLLFSLPFYTYFPTQKNIITLSLTFFADILFFVSLL